MPVNATRGVSQYRVNSGAGRRLFVEGELDEVVMRTLLKDVLDVVRLNGSRSLKRAAVAFRDVEPGYYFLVDRDHLSDEKVEQTWTSFLTGNSNVVYWRRKEIENYFLEPAWLAQSSKLEAGFHESDIQKIIQEFADSYKYFFAANRAYSRVKANFYNTGLQDCIPYKDDYKDDEQAVLQALKDINFYEPTKSILEAAEWTNIYELYKVELGKYSGAEGANTLEWGRGEWLNLMPGKRILNHLICNSGCFHQGSNVKEVIQDLVRATVKDSLPVPADFTDIHSFFAKPLPSA